MSSSFPSFPSVKVCVGVLLCGVVALTSAACSTSDQLRLSASPQSPGGILAADVAESGSAPVCNDFTVQIPENQQTEVDISKAGCTNGPISGYAAAGGPSDGGWELIPRSNGRWVYLPNSQYIGRDSASFVATNAAGATSAPFTVTLDVYAPGSPVCSDITLDVPKNGAVVVGMNNVVCTGGPLVYLDGPYDGPFHGLGYPSGYNGWEYQPNNNYVGTDTATFAVATSGGSVSNRFTVTFVVGGSPSLGSGSQ